MATRVYDGGIEAPSRYEVLGRGRPTSEELGWPKALDWPGRPYLLKFDREFVPVYPAPPCFCYRTFAGARWGRRWRTWLLAPGRPAHDPRMVPAWRRAWDRAARWVAFRRWCP